MLPQASASDGVWEEFRRRVLAGIFIIVLLFVFSRKDAQRWTRRGILIAVLFAVALNVYELFYPLAFSAVLGRSAGLYVNPTQCGTALILGMILSIGLLHQRFRILFALVVGVGVFLTFSRAPSIGWFISVFIMTLTRQINIRRSLVISFAVLCVIVTVMMSQWETLQYQLQDNGVLNKDVLSRVALFSSSGPSLEDDSAVERKMIAEVALESIADAPFVGHGVGASRTWKYERSSHNQYLNMMVDHGVLGFFFLPILVLTITWRASGEARQISYCFSVFILFMGLFSHNLFEEKHTLMIYALLASMVLVGRTEHQGEISLSSLDPQRNNSSSPLRVQQSLRGQAVG